MLHLEGTLNNLKEPEATWRSPERTFKELWRNQKEPKGTKKNLWNLKFEKTREFSNCMELGLALASTAPVYALIKMYKKSLLMTTISTRTVCTSTPFWSVSSFFFCDTQCLARLLKNDSFFQTWPTSSLIVDYIIGDPSPHNNKIQ